MCNIENEVQRGLKCKVALTKMVDILIEMFSYKCTWRMVVDALEAMNFNTAARSLQDLAMTKFATYATTSLSEYRRSDFTSGSSNSPHEETSDELQEHIQTIRKILSLPVPEFSDKAVLKYLYKHIAAKNPSDEGLKKITYALKKIGNLSSKYAKKAFEYVNELEEDFKVVNSVVNGREQN